VDFFLNVTDILKTPEYLKALSIDICLHVYPDKSIAKIVYKSGIKIRVGTTDYII